MTTVISMRTSQEVGPKTPVSSASTVSDEDEESKRISGFSPKANKGAVAPPAATNGISAEKENAEDAMAVDKKDLSDLAKASGALATLQQPQGAPYGAAPGQQYGAPPPSQQPAPAGYAPGPQGDGAYAPVRGLARSQNPPYAGHQPY